MKVLNWLEKYFEEAILCVLLVFIACISLLQIVARAAGLALPWPEEFCRFCWIWTVFLSLPYTIRNQNYLRVSVLIELFPHAVHKVFNLLCDLCTTAIMALFFYTSFGIIGNLIKSNQMSPAMSIPMYIINVCMVIGFGLGIVRGIQAFILHVKTFNERELTSVEMTMQQAEEEAASASKAEGGAE